MNVTSKELFYRSHLRHFIDHRYLKLELIDPGVQYIVMPDKKNLNPT